MTNQLNDYLEYTVPKKYVKMYLNTILRNLFVFLFLTIFLFGIFPSALSIATLFVFTDFVFYNVVGKGTI